ncbi:MAG TPA: hypothetical protein VIV60_05735, partial [Polyangiaceae bacterium]
MSRLEFCWCIVVTALGVANGSCSEHREPPGGALDAGPRRVSAQGDPSANVNEPEHLATGEPQAIGSVDDNMPFVPTGLRAASTAFRTWIYTDTGHNRTRFGYLRVGAVVDVRGPPIKNDGCEEGWLRVNPRGFICLGKGATLDLATPLVTESSVRPVRGQGLPYLYALASDDPPHFYFQLPSRAQVRKIEGRDPTSHFEQWRLMKVESVPAVKALIGTPGEPPDFLQNGGRITKPYGV